MISRKPFLVLSTFILIYSNVKRLNIFLILRIIKMLTKKYNEVDISINLWYNSICGNTQLNQVYLDIG